MYKTEKTPYGFKLTFEGTLTEKDLTNWVDESKKLLTAAPSKFQIFVDMRKMNPLSPEAKTTMETGQKLYKDKGMERSVVILESNILTMQFKRIAQETGIYQWERYINASTTTDWEAKAVNWLKTAVDPDKK